MFVLAVLCVVVAAASLARCHAATNVNNITMCTQLLEFEEKQFSQNGEDGILLYILNLIGMDTKYYVEFGVENGAECNSRMLREHLGFTGLSMDGGFENEHINLKQEFITERNILELFERYHVPQRFDVLSVDTDMFDLWILIRLLRDGHYRPRIIVVETNPSLCVANPSLRFEFGECNSFPLTVMHPDLTPDGQNGRWDGTRYAGANPKAFAVIAKLYGYDMIYCESCGVNCFLVLSTELPASCELNSGYIDYRSPVYVPHIPYPCFGVPGGEGPGHRVDKEKRAAVQLTDTLIQEIQSDTVKTDTLLASKYSCGVGGEGWGADWCSLVGVEEFSYPHLNFDLPARLLQEQAEMPAEAVHWGMLESEAAALGAQCVTRSKSEHLCQLSAKLYRNIGVEILQQGTIETVEGTVREVEMGAETGTGAETGAGTEKQFEQSKQGFAAVTTQVQIQVQVQVQILTRAYNMLLRSEELCPSCPGPVRHLLDLLQYYFAALQLQVQRRNEVEVETVTVTVKQEIKESHRAGGDTAGANLQPHQHQHQQPQQFVLNGLVETDYFRVRNREVQLSEPTPLSFHMYNDLDLLVAKYCRNHAFSVLSPDGRVDNSQEGCEQEMRLRILKEARTQYLPAMSFPLDLSGSISGSRHLCQATEEATAPLFINTIIYRSKLGYSNSNYSDNRGSPPTQQQQQQNQLPSCIAHLVREISSQLMMQC